MIDLSQWRASIGLWNCCQAASTSKPANGYYSSKTGIRKEGKMPRDLLFVGLLIFFVIFIMRHLNPVLLTGKGYILHDCSF